MSYPVKIGLAAMILGTLSLALQNIFFGYVDEAGLVHDSAFLPIGVAAWALGILLFFVEVIRRIWKRCSDKVCRG